MVVRCEHHNAWELNPLRSGRICPECYHSYRTARELRQSYRQSWNRLAASLWYELRDPKTRGGFTHVHDDAFVAPPFMTGWQIGVGWLASRFIRASKIKFCTHCLHDY